MSTEKRLSFLKTQFTKINDEDFEKILSSDPTPEKKYSTWLLRLYSKSKLEIENLSILTEMIQIHSDLKQDIPVEFRDINKFDSVISFLFSMNKWLVTRFNQNEKNITHLKNGGELLFEDDNLSIMKVLNFEGSVFYGSGTKWCTLQRDTFSNYSNDGFLYIILPKNDSFKKQFGKKSQLHFGKSEFRNHDNEEIDLIDIIIKCPSLFEPFSLIKENRENSKFGHFLDIEKLESGQMDLIISKGYDVLKFVKKFSKNSMSELFEEFGEEVYEHIPDSKDKLISFVSSVENGLKKILKKGKIEISDDVFEQAVISFPENVLLLKSDNEYLWKEALKKEGWLINNSPFINDSKKILEAVLNNTSILQFINPVEKLKLEQRKKIATYLVESSYGNMELLNLLGEFDEKFQMNLVEKSPGCIKYIINPFESVKTYSEEQIKEKERREEEKRKTKYSQKKHLYEKRKYIRKIDINGCERIYYVDDAYDDLVYDNGDCIDYIQKNKYDTYYNSYKKALTDYESEEWNNSNNVNDNNPSF